MDVRITYAMHILFLLQVALLNCARLIYLKKQNNGFWLVCRSVGSSKKIIIKGVRTEYSTCIGKSIFNTTFCNLLTSQFPNLLS